MNKEVSLVNLIVFIKNNAIKIIAVSLICAITAFLAVSFLCSPTYTYSGKFIVNSSDDNKQSSTEDITSRNAEISVSVKILPTCIEVLKSKSFFKSVISDSGVDISVADLTKAVSYSVVDETKVFTVSYSSKSKSDTNKIISSIVKLAPDYVLKTVGSGGLIVVDDAYLSKTSMLNKYLVTFAAFIIGAALMIIILYIINFFDVIVRDDTEITEKYDIPVLGIIPELGSPAQKKNRRK